MGLIQKKIIIVFNTLNIGGIERKIVDICNFYSKKNNTTVFLLLKSKKGPFVKKIPKNIKIYGSNGNPWFFVFWLIKKFKKIKPDLIISFGNYCSICSVLAKKSSFLVAKMVISDDADLDKEFKKETFSKIRKILIKTTYPMTDKIILLTESAKKNLNKFVPRVKNKIVVKKNWLPFSFKKTESKKEKDIDILFLARFEPQKNPIKFLKIIKLLKKRKNKIKVLMVGFGSLKNKIENFIKSNNLTKNVIVKEATIKPNNYYQRAKLLVLTSDYEGFPLTILEAFSQNCIPICNKIREICDFFEKYSEDLLYNDIDEAVDKILSLLNNQEKMEKIYSYYQKKIFLEQQINFKKTINEFEKYCK